MDALWTRRHESGTPRRLRTNALVAFALLIAVTGVASCSSDGSSSGVPGATFTVHAKDNNKFDKSQYTAKAGNLTIGYKNDGQLLHTLLIEGHPEFKLSVARNQPSTSGAIALPPGTYTMFCDIPGHREEGMVAQLSVQ